MDQGKTPTPSLLGIKSAAINHRISKHNIKNIQNHFEVEEWNDWHIGKISQV
jgi:hypothetical protein